YNADMIDPFQLGLMVVFLATQEVLRKRWTAKISIPAIMLALLVLVFGGITYTDVLRYVILVGAAFAEANSGGDVVHLALMATFKIQPVFLVASFLKARWTNQESILLMLAAAFFQMAYYDAKNVLSWEVPDVLNSLSVAWMILRAISFTNTSNVVVPLLALLTPGLKCLNLDVYRILLLMVGVGSLIKEKRSSAAKKKGACLICLALASTGVFNPMILAAGLMACDPNRKR
nr:non-structural protein NS2a [West Nile virus]